MKIAYFDLSSGVAGDMLVGALLDAGLDESKFLSGLAGLGLSGYTIKIEKVFRSSIRASYFKVVLEKGHLPSGFEPFSELKSNKHGHGHHHVQSNFIHRNLHDIISIIQSSSLPESVKENVIKVFYRLGEVEAQIHGVTIDKIHFHEVGAIDSIVDIVACCLGVYLLGIEKIYFSEFCFGVGEVKCSHGIMPEPVPATLSLTVGYRTRQTRAKGELTTPTGAALLTVLGTQLQYMPDMVIEKVGYGAGTRVQTEVLGATRVLIGKIAQMPNQHYDVKYRKILFVTCNIDDMAAEQMGFLLDKLWEVSKQDVWLQSIYMKKNRVATQLNVLAELSDLSVIQKIIFTHSSSFGFRFSEISKIEFERRVEIVEIDGYKIRVKIGMLNAQEKISPEYEDCQNYAKSKNKALQDVYFEVTELAKKI